MKNIKRGIIFLITIIIVISSNFFSYGYAFYDVLYRADNVVISIGTWEYQTNTSVFFTDFENFPEYGGGVMLIEIGGLDFITKNVVRGDKSIDQKIGDSSIRLFNKGIFGSRTYFIGLKLISFYIGLTEYNMSYYKGFNVEISSNGYDWSTVYHNEAYKDSFDLIEIDMESILSQGVELYGGNLATQLTPLQFRIIADSSFSSAGCNIDNLTIEYTDIY